MSPCTTARRDPWSRRGGPAVVLVVLLVLLGLGARAGAAPPELDLAAELGWKNVLVPERWCPFRVVITARGGGPLTRAFDGFVLVTYTQDATQRAQLRLHVAGTPGQVARVDGVLCVPPQVGRVEFQVVDAAGKEQSAIRFEQFPDVDRGEAPLPTLLARGALMVVADGSAQLPDRLLSVWRSSDDTFAYMVAPPTRCEQVAAGELPVSPAAYDSLDLLIVDGSSPAHTDRSVAAIREWVLSGGRLLVLAAKGGAEWRRWLPTGLGGDLVRMGPPASGPPSAAIADALETLVPTDAKTDAPEHDLITRDGISTSVLTGRVPVVTRQRPQLAAAIAHRKLALTERARDDGWLLRWTDADDPSSGLIGEGPVGFGWVTIVGVEPRRCITSLSDDDAAPLWRDAIDRILGQAGSGATSRYASSGPSDQAAAALGSALDTLVTVPPLSPAVFVAIAASMVLLSGLVGPGDYLLLRRRSRRRWSWATAIGWTAAASAMAYGVPLLLRDSSTRLGRLTVIDAIQTDGATPALAYQAGVTGIWAGRAREADLVAVSRGPDARGERFADLPPDSTQWRGVSSVAVWNFEQPSALIPTATFQQRPPSIDRSPDPWGGVLPAMAGSTRPASPGTALRGWTFRAFMDSGRVRFPLTAMVTGRAGAARVRIAGIPAGARVVAGVLHDGGEWFPLTFAPASPATPRAAIEHEGVAGKPFLPRVAVDPIAALVPPGAEESTDSADRDGVLHLSRIASPFALAGPAQRTPAALHRVGTGRWVAIHLDVRDLPADIGLAAEPAGADRRAIIRLLVPVPD